MEIKYVPQPIKEENDKGEETVRPNPFEGTVTVEVPKYRHRLALIKELNLKFGSDGKVDSSVDQIDMAVKMADLAEKHAKSIDLTHKPTGEKVKTFEELEYSRDGAQMINEIAGIVVGGASLGNA